MGAVSLAILAMSSLLTCSSQQCNQGQAARNPMSFLGEEEVVDCSFL